MCTHHFVGKMPPDTRIEQISRTVGLAGLTIPSWRLDHGMSRCGTTRTFQNVRSMSDLEGQADIEPRRRPKDRSAAASFLPDGGERVGTARDC
jgi:hypothetical protein